MAVLAEESAKTLKRRRDADDLKLGRRDGFDGSEAEPMRLWNISGRAKSAGRHGAEKLEPMIKSDVGVVEQAERLGDFPDRRAAADGKMHPQRGVGYNQSEYLSHPAKYHAAQGKFPSWQARGMTPPRLPQWRTRNTQNRGRVAYLVVPPVPLVVPEEEPLSLVPLPDDAPLPLLLPVPRSGEPGPVPSRL